MGFCGISQCKLTSCTEVKVLGDPILHIPLKTRVTSIRNLLVEEDETVDAGTGRLSEVVSF